MGALLFAKGVTGNLESFKNLSSIFSRHNSCMYTMSGIELILSAVCNITSCEPQHASAHPVVNIRLHRELEYKAAREMINGKHLQIGTFNDAPFCRINIDKHGNVIGLGMVSKLVKILSKKFNFTYDIIIPPSEVRDRKGRELWLVERLIEHKIDVAAAFISVTPELQNMITFDLETDTFNCLFTKDSRSPSLFDPDKILQPFQTTVWVCFVLMLALYITCLVLLTRLRSKLLGDDEEPFTVSSSISYVYRVCTQQDVQQSPKASMTRILLMTWSIFVILMSTFYAANLSKSFTITSVTERDNIEEQLKWFEENGVVLVWKWLLYGSETWDVTHVTSCIEMLSLNHFIKRPRAFAYHKNTTLKNLFSREIKKLYYAGILEKFYRSGSATKHKICPAVVSSAMRKLGLQGLKVNYYCWFVGVTSGLGAFLIELLLGWRKKSKVAPVVEIHLQQMDKGRSVDSDDEDCGLSSSQSSPSFQRRTVNGRQYLVAQTKEGEPRLVPEDTLSALLFDLNSYEPTDCGKDEDQI